jgi:hypothetical protein
VTWLWWTYLIGTGLLLVVAFLLCAWGVADMRDPREWLVAVLASILWALVMIFFLITIGNEWARGVKAGT